MIYCNLCKSKEDESESFKMVIYVNSRVYQVSLASLCVYGWGHDKNKDGVGVNGNEIFRRKKEMKIT